MAKTAALASKGPSIHLTWKELQCKDAQGTPYPERWRTSRARNLSNVFELIRAACGGKPLTILSGYRTPEHNRAVSGARFSQHVEGRAIDIACPSHIKIATFFALIRTLAETETRIRGIGYYEKHNFVHVDIRPTDKLVVWDGKDARKEA